MPILVTLKTLVLLKPALAGRMLAALQNNRYQKKKKKIDASLYAHEGSLVLFSFY